MNRRQFNLRPIPLLASVLLLAQQQAHALSISDLSDREATQGLKAALETGAMAAVKLLGQTDGFLGNERVRIPLPGYLEDASKLLRVMGQGGRIDELVVAMNRAAEAAMPLAKELLLGAVRAMNVTDAKNILTGGDTSVTRFFAEKTRSPLSIKFAPVIARTTAKVALAEKYNRVAARVADMGLVKKEDATIERYVTAKSLDGLYFMIGEEEKKIRRDPVGTGSAILKKVFGALN